MSPKEMSWTKKKTRYELNTGNFTGVILTVDKYDFRYSSFRFFWAIYYTEYLHPTNADRKPPDIEKQILSSSAYEHTLKEAKAAVQERILEYKITDGVGKAKYK